MQMSGQRRAVNLRRTFLGVNRWWRLYILSDASATSVRRLLAAAPKTGITRLLLGQRRASRAEGCESPSWDLSRETVHTMMDCLPSGEGDK